MVMRRLTARRNRQAVRVTIPPADQNKREINQP